MVDRSPNPAFTPLPYEIVQSSASRPRGALGGAHAVYRFAYQGDPYLVEFAWMAAPPEAPIVGAEGGWEVKFYREHDKRYEIDRYDLTRTGGAVPVLGTVMAILREFIRLRAPAFVEFAADNRDASRGPLYERLFAYTGYLPPEYVAVVKDTSWLRRFYIVRQENLMEPLPPKRRGQQRGAGYHLVRQEGRRPNPVGQQHFLVRSPAQGLRVIQHPAIVENFAKALRVRPKHANAVLVPCAGTKPFPEAPSHKSGYLPALEGKRADVWVVSEPLGVVPYAWSRTWPNDAYDFPPKYLRGPAREALVARIGEWLDKVAPKYEHVYLALPGHHRRLLDEALAGRDLKIRDAGHGACIESGACPAGHGRATSHAYRGYLQRRIPNPAPPRWAAPYLAGQPLFHVTSEPSFRIDPTRHAYVARGMGRLAEQPTLFLTDNLVFWTPFFYDRPRLYVARVVLSSDTIACDMRRTSKPTDELCPGVEPMEWELQGDGLRRARVEEVLSLADTIRKYGGKSGGVLNTGSVLDWWNAPAIAELQAQFTEHTGARTFDEALALNLSTRKEAIYGRFGSREKNPTKRRGGHLRAHLAKQFAKGVSYLPPLPVGTRVMVPRAASETDLADEGAFVVGSVVAQRAHTGPDAASENTLVRFDRGSYWSGKESWYEPDYMTVMDDAARFPNPGLEMRLWKKPILWDAEKVEVEVGQVPPGALLLAAMQGPLVVPVAATLPGKRSRVHAGIEMEGLIETPGGSEIPAWGTPAVKALLAHHKPELAVSPTGHKWYSWEEAAPRLLSLLVEHGARTGSQHESEPIDLWIDSHLPNPPHHRIRFRAWTVPAEPRRKNPAEPCGDCFRYAVFEGSRGNAVKVFHGTIRDPETGRRFDHAWLEDPQGLLYDWQNQTRRIEPALYYAELHPEDVIEYEPMQALRYAIANAHYGPWPPEERTEQRRRPIPRLGPRPPRALPSRPPCAPAAPRPRPQTRRALDRQIRDARVTGDLEHARELEAERDKLPPKKTKPRKRR